MKKSTFAVLGLVASMAFSMTAFAGSPVLSVKINSFTHIGDVNSTLGEVCGTVTVTNTQIMPASGSMIPISVTSDPNTSNPGVYTVLADQTGNFCVVINTYTGTASAEAWLPGTKADSSLTPIAPSQPGRAK